MRLRLALVTLVVGVLLACTPQAGLVGNSISWQLEREGGVTNYAYIDASRGRTAFHAGFSGEDGNGIAGARRVAASVKPKAWVVIEIGTNDVTNHPRDYHFRVQGLLDAVPKDRCVAFVNVRRATLHDRSDIWNAIVALRIKDHPCRRIIDWNAAVIANPALLGPDGVHPSELGKRWLRLLLIQTSQLPFGAHPS